MGYQLGSQSWSADGHRPEVEVPSAVHHRKDPVTWSVAGWHKVRCCSNGCEGGRFEERYCWLACEGDPGSAEAFGVVRGSWDEEPWGSSHLQATGDAAEARRQDP